MPENQQQIMTFYVEELLFGLDIAHVLLLGQDITAVQPLPVKESGLVGMIKLQSIAIPVINFAHRVGMRSVSDEKTALLTQFETVKQGYQDWFQEIQWKLTARRLITREELSQNINLLNWDKQVQCRDIALQNLLNTLMEPKSAFIACFEQLIILTSQHQWQQAEILFNQHKESILAQIELVFDRAREQLETSVRQVLLYLTKDGKTPSYALLIDQVNDVLSYSSSNFQSCETGAMGVIRQVNEAVDGLYVEEGKPECFYFTLNKLLNSHPQLATA
jgi:chemotaxis signal transduction protein